MHILRIYTKLHLALILA